MSESPCIYIATFMVILSLYVLCSNFAYNNYNSDFSIHLLPTSFSFYSTYFSFVAAIATN